MFNEEFYPTPKAVIKKMIEPYLYGDKTIDDLIILEPSAGKGDILDYICEHLKERYYRYRNDVPVKAYCCEVNPELKAILQSKKYKVIADDFLEYNGDYLFDLILMNPPFSNGDEHLLKAWEILDKGEIVCLLNSETLHNIHSERRQHLRKLILQHGSIEHLGQVFRTAERKTNVEVSIVRLKKEPKRSKLDFEFHNITRETAEHLSEETFKNPIAVNDIVGNMVIQYNKVKACYVEYLKAKEALSFYSQGIIKPDSLEQLLNQKGESINEKYNGFSDDLKQLIWSVVMDKTKVEKYMTHAVRQNFNEFAKAQGCMDFTKENVAALVDMIFTNRYDILEKAIVDVFDIFTRHHQENRYMVEGWKTNSKWKVNKKIILPYWIEMSYSGCYNRNHRRWDEYSDIEKVMCYITGKKFEEIATVTDAISKIKIGDSSLHTSEFFNLRCYKKGTLHLYFKDESLWNEFNLRACAGKQWLPESEMKQYREQRAKEESKQLLLA